VSGLVPACLVNQCREGPGRPATGKPQCHLIPYMSGQLVSVLVWFIIIQPEFPGDMDQAFLMPPLARPMPPSIVKGTKTVQQLLTPLHLGFSRSCRLVPLVIPTLLVTSMSGPILSKGPQCLTWESGKHKDW
jgi:hypothetical protein